MMRFFVLALLCLTVSVHARDDKKDIIDPVLKEVVRKVDERNSDIESMQARFTQRKEISLFKDPVEMKGDFFLKRETGIRFKFDPDKDDEEMEIIVTDKYMVSFSHKAKEATQIKMKKRKMDLTRFLIYEKLHDLLAYFDIARAGNDDGTGPQQLILMPTVRKLKKRINQVSIWFDETYLIHRVNVIMKDGDIYEVSLSDVKINTKLDDAMFDTTVPEDYKKGERIEHLLGSGF